MKVNVGMAENSDSILEIFQPSKLINCEKRFCFSLNKSSERNPITDGNLVNKGCHDSPYP